MNDLTAYMKTVSRAAMFFLAICLLVWALVPQAKPYAAGLVLGTVISLINARLLGAKIQAITRLVMENTGKRINSGFISRACMALIGTMICVKFPQFDLISMIIGLFFVQMATLLMGILSYFKTNKGMRGKG
ncbi:ATP synthase I chain [Chlamydia abortus]|jgi:ATP synthase protein I|uniref:ATP synthase subunit I n=1 Tax=Paenibacillus residui TaxID=629724 RepID=A0ABW3DHX7_9BACL|nr:ATP synthase I chain [Chlamydia abortus]